MSKTLKTLKILEEVARAGSIRKAADDLNLTASALTRRIQGIEDEFGAEVFERLPRGVRLNAAGELLLHHHRTQRSDFERVQRQVADLSGVRRGHVSIGCSQAVQPYFLPRQIARYRAEHPGVSFRVNVRDRRAAEADLSAFVTDLALVFEPVHMVDFKVIASAPQAVHVLMTPDNPLAQKATVRLRDCLALPHVVPTEPYGVRHLLSEGARRTTRELAPVLECDSFELARHYVRAEGAVAFQIPIGIDPLASGLVSRPLATTDVPPGHLLLGQMRGRVLPVASARFADQLVNALQTA
ncbi:MAG: LysR family transcriptional regulator [Pseudomonadota bacterium]